jgi:hypothetical protein
MGGEGIVVPNHPGARGESLAELRRRDVVRKRAAGPRTADFRSREVNGISASHRSRRSGPREWTSTTGRLETGKTKKKLCLALFGVWFGLFFGFVVKYHGFSRRLRRYASVARHRQLISPSIVVTVTGFLFRPLEFTSHTV